MADDPEVERMPHPEPAGLDTEALIALLNNHDPIDGEIARRLRASEADRRALAENVADATERLVDRHKEAKAAEAARDAALAEAAALREALETFKRERAAEIPAKLLGAIIDAALSTPPSAALADLRARVRAEALEEAAKWHDKQAEILRMRPHDYQRGWRRKAQMHEESAAAIRAMKGQGDG